MNDFDRSLEKHDQLHLSRRIIPLILGIFLFLIFVSFMIGYFLGIKHTTDEFVTQIRHETLADQLLVSAVTEAPTIFVSNNTGESPSDPVTICENNDPIKKNISENTSENVTAEILTSYNAELIGFGTQQAAQDFIKRVHKYSSIPLDLKERSSKTPRGKLITWYQVVTGKYEQKQELQNILDILIKKEHLHDVKIVAYSATKKDLA